jgi:UDP-N-acetyl-D-glucosamine dehydrogenase
MLSSPLTLESLKASDATVIVANHRSLDYEFIVRNARLIIDTRNATAGYRELNGNVLLA